MNEQRSYEHLGEVLDRHWKPFSMFECSECGALVANTWRHDEWHDKGESA